VPRTKVEKRGKRCCRRRAVPHLGGVLSAKVKPVLPEGCQVEMLGGLSLWSSEPSVNRQFLLDTFPDLSRPACPPGGHLLKSARQRHVCRIPLAGGTAVAKLFPLSSPLSWPRWRKFALAEHTHMREAIRRGAPAPRPLAFFMQRRWGVVRCTGLLMEDLVGWKDLREIARAEGTLVACALATPILRALAATGCLHADARDENLLVSPDRSRSAVIDWQYAAFVAPGADWALEHLLAYYLRKSEETRGEELVVRALSLLARGDEALMSRVRRLLGRPPSLRRRLACAPAL
jgi:hypothetical protein